MSFDFLQEYKVWIIIAIVVIVLAILYDVFLVKRNAVKNAFATMDVMLKRRFDLMPNLVQAVKMYMEHENDLFETITELRSKVFDDKTSNNDKLQANEDASAVLGRINALAENYPALKSDANLMQAQVSLKECEDDINAARRLYDTTVTTYNNVTGFFPLNLFALLMGFRKYKLFEATVTERQSQNWFTTDEQAPPPPPVQQQPEQPTEPPQQ